MAVALPVLSLFSGAGCLDLAVERCAEPFGANGTRTDGPFRVAVATDYDARALRSLQANFPGVPTICGDIRELSTRDLLDTAGVARGEAELVVGGPPCTPFSKSGFWLEEKRRYVFTDRDDSLEALEEAIDATCSWRGIADRPVIVDGKLGGVCLDNDTFVTSASDYSTRLVYRHAQDTAR